MIKTIILAAGEGTRMKSNKSKVLHKLLNKEILSYIVDASNLEDSQTIVIGGKNKAYIEENYKNVIVKEQKIGPNYPYGTGYAVSLALDLINDDDIVLVLNGDIPLIKKESIERFLTYHKKENNACTVLTTFLKDPKGYGRIVRDKNGFFYKIVEDKDASKEEINIKEINIGIYAFNGLDLKESIGLINDSNNSQHELYITDCIQILKNKDKKVNAYISEDYTEFYGINNKYELQRAEKILRRRVNKAYMEEGVIMETPEIITIEPGVKIGKDTIISGYVKILGKTEIGENCIIEGSTRIEDSKISDNVKIDNSIIEKSKVGKNTDIGPFSHLRPKADLDENVHIGNFVEVKNSFVGKKTKAGHLAYIGDSDLGEAINVGCGVIFVNYDGKFKHRSVVEDGAFIGSNSNIVAPVRIYKEGYIAAGSTITKDVDTGALSIERAEQKNILGYVEKKKKKDLEIQRSKDDK
ncbi:MAG: bifunctional UDP-N-acetylglucosamine diphosphorylase/glucosamine-1-phosphate N-acetyltransferase GlmU [Peptoniphilaceae bacterium]|nr:bifunctional UDP-N-acetylglucosamine diphosphorylase/glucosamine-1-phosphate N-acetyltransferase GlmU [Peptoniphilaceae bacterium]MDY6019637.1 bifunctional UDP-N-acetylglucosamine diphosphorylase/glucosamine-1-phosphate N-acetyltransferase GlmU [Anaerococcus sp.]